MSLLRLNFFVKIRYKYFFTPGIALDTKSLPVRRVPELCNASRRLSGQINRDPG